MANPDIKPPESPTIKTDKASETVYVGCKIPNGIIFDELPSGRAVRLKGHYEPVGKDNFVIANDGSGITAVPGDLWKEVMAAHGEHAAIKNGLIYAVSSSREDALAEAKNRKSVKSGMEQKDQTDAITKDAE